MLKLSFFICNALLLFLTATAAPVDDAAKDISLNPAKFLDKRTIGGIYITTDINWGGEKGYKVQPLVDCIQLTAPW
ncbi:hypothetical protein ABW19_dt0210439 [Dactylella cylindrospora]|nr:hypothetical protein ABW19_dt0210439 [Dactylella cylindrospora]